MLIDLIFNIDPAAVDLKFDINPAKVDLKFNNYQRVIATGDSIERYKGDYEVTPTLEGETLPTKQKLMEEDLTVNPIPIYETSNISGGTTVYIAKG